MNKNYIVYKTINKISGLIYIGVHNNSDSSYLGSGLVLNRVIKKYGNKNFRRITLHKNLTAEEAYKIEKKIVTEAFVKSKRTYNLKVGGCGGFEYINKTTTLKQKAIMNSTSEEATAKRVNSFKKTLAEKRKDEEYNNTYTQQNISNFNGKECKYHELPEQVKLNRNIKISNALKGNKNSTGEWAKENQSKAVHQFSKLNEFIATFISINEAAKHLGKNASNIRKVIDKENKTSYGYKWKSAI